MAIRYCGDMRISVVYEDRWSQYRCSVSPIPHPDARKTMERAMTRLVCVGNPPSMKIAVDSPQAYDDAASAAISFLVENLPGQPDMTANGSGWKIRRSK